MQFGVKTSKTNLQIDASIWNIFISLLIASVAGYKIVNTDVDASQVTYSNASTYNSMDCEKDPYAKHGINEYGDKIQFVECRDEGAIIGIHFTHSNHEEGRRLHSITFICNSSYGITSEGPFGTTGKYLEKLDCKPNEHVSYIRGRAGYFVNDISIVCAEYGHASANYKQEGRKVNVEKQGQVTHSHDRNITTRDISVDDFDDSCFASKGGRPVKLEIFTKTYVNAIKTYYKNIPVALNCIKTQIELVGNYTHPTIKSYEVLGIAIGSSCSDTVQQLCLTVQQTHTIEKIQGNSSSNVKMNAVSGHSGGQAGYWEETFGAGFDISFYPTFSWVGETEWDKSESNTIGIDHGKSHKATINYKGPGAGILVGYRAIYGINHNSTDVLYHYTCERGSVAPTEGELPIHENVYGNVHFEDYHFPFGNKECTTELRVCISRIKLNNVVLRPKLLQAKLRTEVNKCFLKKLD